MKMVFLPLSLPLLLQEGERFMVKGITEWHEILAGVIFGGFAIFAFFFSPRLADFNLADRSQVDAYT